MAARSVLQRSGAYGILAGFTGQPLTDADFYPDFEQNGVDMRIGIDIANLSANRSVERIVLATNDTDCIPAMKRHPMANMTSAPGTRAPER